MRHRLVLVALGLILLSALPAAAQLPPEKALATFAVSDGLEISLWASEPLFANPTCIDIDHKGRVWVCESVNYRTQLRKTKPNRPEGDRIVILEDTDGDGKADRGTTFYQAPDFLAPLGIAVAPDPDGKGCKVYVCHSPHIYLFDDRDGDLKADGPPKVLLTGFKGYDHDHGVHGILIGPDGKLYFSVGDQGVDGLKDRHGKVWRTNQTDCRAGTIWRCDLDGTNLELLAHNFRNEYEPCVDSFGTIFVSDNDDDGNQQTRICYVMPGGNYGYWPRGPGQSHWHEEQPGVAPKILRTYFGSPTGMCVYEGTLLPAQYRGQPLHTDAGPRHLRCYHTKPDGAGYAVEPENMVQSSDNWFRPSDVCVAPDGSVFVSDWYDPGVGGHGMGDTTRGRIYRITPKGHQGYKVPAVELGSNDGILAALGSPNLAVRHMAMAKLRTLKPGQVYQWLIAASRKAEPSWLAARAMWQISIAHRDVPHFGKMHWAGLSQMWDDPRIRQLSLRIDKDAFRQSPADVTTVEIIRPGNLGGQKVTLTQGFMTDQAAIRREALIQLRDADPAKAKSYIYALAKQYDGKDRFYLTAIGIAVGTDPARRDAILADFTKHFPELDEKTLSLVWELRPPQVMPLLEKKLADASLPAAQRGQIVDILASADDVSAGKSLLNVLHGQVSADVRGRVVENLKLFLPGKWRELQKAPELKATITRLLQEPATRVEALALIGAADRVETVGQVRAIAQDAKESPTVRSAAVKTLGDLPSVDAVQALVALLETDPPALRTEAVQALGEHIHQRRRQAGPTLAPALGALQQLAIDGGRDVALRLAAAAALAGSQAGTEWLLAQQAKQQLPEIIKPEVARLLRNSPFQALRNKALIAFPPPGRIDPSKLPSIAALAARKGNADRGKQLLAASVKSEIQCLKCHTIRGAGGSIGPDLSVIGKKASRENLVESILLPSKAIADQYVTWVIETKKGQVLSGLVVGETPEGLTLRDANGKDYVLDRKDVVERAKGPNSLMPADLLAHMTEDDLVDIVEYLFALKTPALAVDSWHILGPFDCPSDADLDQVLPPEKAVDLKASYPGKGGTVSWRTVKPNEQGYVDLRAFLGSTADNVVSYLYREIESPADQDATLLLSTDDCAKLWVNGTVVYTNRRHRAATPEEDAVPVRLRKGTNRLLLKITNGNGPHGFYFTALAEQEVKPVAAR